MKRLSLLKRLIFLSVHAVSLIFIFIIGVDAGEKIISAEEFQWMARSSVNILNTFKLYNSELEKYKPNFYADYDNVLTPGYEYRVQTPSGNWNVGPVQGNMGFYAGHQNFGLMGVVNGINLLIDSKHKTGEYSELTGWANYYYVLALRFSLNEDFQIIAGGIMKQTPYFINDDGVVKFGAYRDSDGVIQTNDNKIEMLGIIRIYGYELGTILNYDDKNAGTVSLDGSVFKNKRFGSLDLAAKYYDFDRTFQLGYTCKDFFVLDFFSLGSGGFFNAYSKDKNSPVVSHVTAYDTIYVFRDSVAFSPSDFFLALRTGISYTRDHFKKSLIGYIAELSAHNIQLIGITTELLVAASYNFQETVIRVPVEDQFLLSFKIRVLY